MNVQEREGMLQVISDLSKDARGYRVRLAYDAMSNDELQRTWDGFIDEMEESTRRESLQKLSAQKDWETHIAELMQIGASDRATAIRWDMEAVGAMTCNGSTPGFDVSYYCYLAGLDYALEDSIEADLAYKH